MPMGRFLRWSMANLSCASKVFTSSSVTRPVTFSPKTQPLYSFSRSIKQSAPVVGVRMARTFESNTGGKWPVDNAEWIEKPHAWEFATGFLPTPST